MTHSYTYSECLSQMKFIIFPKNFNFVMKELKEKTNWVYYFKNKINLEWIKIFEKIIYFICFINQLRITNNFYRKDSVLKFSYLSYFISVLRWSLMLNNSWKIWNEFSTCKQQYKCIPEMIKSESDNLSITFIVPSLL